MTLRAIVIGAGNMGMNHVRVLSNMKDVELVGVADPDDRKLTQVLLRHRVPALRDYHELFPLRPDIAIIASPNELHADHATGCLSQGVSVLIEKPVVTTLDASLSVTRWIEIALIESGRAPVVAAGHIERFNPAVVELKRQIAMGNAGTIYEIRTERYSPYPSRMKGTGVALDLATHDIDLMRFVVGKPIKLVEHRLCSRNKKNEDLVSALFEFEGGTLGSLHANWLTPKKIRRLTLTCSSGYYEANLLTQELWFHENGEMSQNEMSALHGVSEGNVTGFWIERAEPLVLELEDFVQAVRERKAPRATFGDGVAAVEVALKLQA